MSRVRQVTRTNAVFLCGTGFARVLKDHAGMATQVQRKAVRRCEGGGHVQELNAPLIDECAAGQTLCHGSTWVQTELHRPTLAKVSGTHP